MSTPGVGVADPGDWIQRWLSRYPSSDFAEVFLSLVFEKLSDPEFEEGPGVATLTFLDGLVEADVTYYLERFSTGRILHVISILAPGEPFPG